VWASAASGGAYTLAGATADKKASSLRISGLSAVPTYYLMVRTVSDPNSYNQNTVASDFSAEISIAMPVAAMDLTLSAGGAATAATIGSTGALETGYARVDMSSGNAFYGIAVYSYRPDGIVVSECGVPASPPTTSARIFVDYRTGATIPGASGKVNIDTGLALVNRGTGPATINFTLRDLNGQVLSMGTGSLARDAHVAKYLWELPAMVSGFSIPTSFATETRYGTLELGSDQPLSVVALRLTTNQRGEMLMTSTPVADLRRPLSTAPTYFAEFIDGGGYTTTLMLLNTSGVMMTGTLRMYDNDGAPLAVQQVGGASGSAFAYSIAPGGAYVLQTDAAPVNFKVGWVELIPDPGTATPMGAGVYQSSQDGVLAAESGIAAAIPTTHARIFVDTAGGHNSSVALANPGAATASIAFTALGMDGATTAGTSVGPMTLNGKGHAAQFVWERISGLPEGFRGVLDIVSETAFVPLTIRALINERGDFLFAAFPVADMNQAAPSPILFPQIAAGGGTKTEIIMLSAGAAGAATLRYFGNAGTPLAIGK
jgi:hypothetical protein